MLLPDDESLHFETICTHLGEDPRRYQGAVVPPIFQNSLFTFESCSAKEQNYNVSADGAAPAGGVSQGYDYSRVANPTTDIAEAKIAALEGGERARLFGSGMGAVSAAIFSCIKAGDHVVAPLTVYGPTRHLLSGYLNRFGIEATFIQGDEPEEWEAARRPNTTLFFLESPSSVVFRQQDLAAVASIAREHGVATIIDNSWATPIFQRPIRHGIDLVLHSATKYLGGHSDIVAGVVVGSAERMRRMTFDEGCLFGAMLDPFAAWLLIRGLRTLPIRMERHQKSARQIALALQEHPAVSQVLYPGLPDDPQCELTARQLRGTSGLMTVVLKENSRTEAHRVVDALRYFGIGCSWGGFESLALPMALPASAIREPSEETRWMLRLHVGLETVEDLWADLDAALLGSSRM